jgi:hypothetical protein
METKNYNLTGLSNDVQFGKSGPRIISDGTSIGVYDANGDLANLQVAPAIEDQSVATMKQLNDILGQL